jgi:hypothetical protein
MASVGSGRPQSQREGDESTVDANVGEMEQQGRNTRSTAYNHTKKEYQRLRGTSGKRRKARKARSGGNNEPSPITSQREARPMQSGRKGCMQITHHLTEIVVGFFSRLPP